MTFIESFLAAKKARDHLESLREYKDTPFYYDEAGDIDALCDFIDVIMQDVGIAYVYGLIKKLEGDDGKDV